MMADGACKVINEAGAGVDEDMLCRCATKTLSQNGGSGKSLSIVVAGEDRMQKLNKLHYGKDTATDVLSFSNIEEGGYLGEVVICPSYVERNTAREKLNWELCHIAVHGTFHLLGIHHEHDEKAHQKIHEQEIKIIQKVLKLTKLIS